MRFFLHWFLCLITVLIVTTCNCSYSPLEPEQQFWKYNPELKDDAVKLMEEEKAKLHTLDDVAVLMARFIYITEVKSFEPSIYTIFARGLIGNCTAASVLGKWALGCIGIPARYVDIYSNKWGWHRICVSNDNTIMITVNEVIFLNRNDWVNSIFEYYKFDLFYILVDGKMKYRKGV